MEKNIQNDPLLNPAYKGPGFLEKLGEAFFGGSKNLDCVQIEISSECTGLCLYCPHTIEKAHWRGKNMSAETFSRLWPLLRRSGRAHLQGWGEPFLHPRFFDFSRFARKAGCQVSTTSCGLKMSTELAEQIKLSEMDMLAFSLVGTDEKSNSARQGVPFSQVRENVMALTKYLAQYDKSETPAIHIAYLMLADRMEAVLELPQILEEWRVDMAVVSTLDYIGHSRQQNLAFASHETEKIDKARDILLRAAEDAQNRGKQIFFALPGLRPVADAGGCRENVRRTGYVNVEGEISPCVYLNVQGMDENKRRVFGNVNLNDAWQIWRNPEYLKFRDGLCRNNPDNACLNCQKRYEIQG